MPDHKKGESREDWMSRCVPHLIKKENKTPEQASGQCGGMYDSWEKSGKMAEEPETYDLPDKEIFAAGKWRSSDGSIHEFSIDDLHNIVENFNELKGQADPAIKIGHDDKQEIAKKLGLFSLGWLDNLRVAGDKIISDFKKVPSKLYKIIKNGGLKRVSPEITYNYQAQPNGKVYPIFLKAIALLGADQKAMKTLKDIVDVYSEEDVNDVILELDYNTAVFTEGVTYEENKNNNKTKEYNMELEKMLTEKEAELKELKGKFSEAESKVETLENEKTTLETQIRELTGQISKFNEEKKKGEIEDWVNSRIDKGRIPKASKEKYEAHFSKFEGNELKAEQEIIDLTLKTEVDFEEHSIDTDNDNDKPDNKTNELGDEIENDDIDKKVKVRMAEFNEDYPTANAKLIELGAI